MIGLTGTFEMYFQAPDKMYQSIDMGVMSLAQGYDGHIAWLRDPNGQHVELSGMEYKLVMNTLYILNNTYLKADAERPMFMGQVLFENKPYYEYKAYPPGGDSLVLYVSEESGFIEKYKAFVDEITLLTNLADFREVDGIPTAMFSWTESSNPLLNDTMIVSETEMNIPIDPSIFAMNSEGVVDYLFPEGLDSVVVPLVIEQGHLGFKTTVNGHPGALFILDSGAGMNSVDKRFADKIGLDAAGELLAKGVTGYGEAAVTALDTVEIGGIRLFGQKAAVIDFYGQEIRFGDDFAGLLGFDFISRFPLAVDFAAKTMTIFNPDHNFAVDEKMAIPFRMMLKIPIIEASIGNCAGDFLVDLGNPLGVIVHKAFLDKCDLDSSLIEISGNMAFGGIGGAARAEAGVAHDFRIGNAEIKTVPIVIAEGEGGLIRSTEVDGNIGTNFLEKFTVLLDYKGNTIYLLPGSDEKK